MLADSITSVLAIAALVVGAWLEIFWLDAVTALVAAALIVLWARGLLRETSRPLLDTRAPASEIAKIEEAVLAIDGVSRVSVVMWDIGSERRALAIDLTSARRLGPREVRAAVPDLSRFVHTAIEIHHDDGSSDASPT